MQLSSNGGFCAWKASLLAAACEELGGKTAGKTSVSQALRLRIYLGVVQLSIFYLTIYLVDNRHSASFSKWHRN